MSRIRRAGSWTVAVAALAGLGTSVLQYFTNQDSAHVTAAATIATTDRIRWKAHDQEHELDYTDSIRARNDLRNALSYIEELKVAIASVRKECELHQAGRKHAAKKEAKKSEALLAPKMPVSRTRISNRRSIADMEIRLRPEAVKQKAKELYE
jgi:type VI protein secretion system component VasK